jgi:hypothetical protein
VPLAERSMHTFLHLPIKRLIGHHVDLREQQNRIPSIVKCSERQDQDKRESCRIDDTKLKHEIFTTSASNAKHQFFF